MHQAVYWLIATIYRKCWGFYLTIITELVILIPFCESDFTLTLPRHLVRMVSGVVAPFDRHTRRKGIR